MLNTLAHGVGSRGDLPLPLWQFTWAATAALVVSFVALGVLWTQPRLAGAAIGRAIGGTKLVAIAEPVARTASFLLYLLVLAAGLFGTDTAAANINPVTLYVIFWVVLQGVCVALGDVWKVLSPFDTMAIGLARFRREPTEVADVAAWFAPLGALGFLFLELAHPSGDSPRVLGVAVLIYSVAVMTAVWLWGRRWLREGETFAVLFGLLGTLAPLGSDGHGRLRLRPPLSGLASVRVTPAATALILIVLGGTSFDGLSESEFWVDLVGRHQGWTDAWWKMFGLIDAIVAVSGLYLIGVWAMVRATGRPMRELSTRFAPSLMPIVFGYTVAHYLQLAVDETQTFVFRLSDPFGRGWDLFGGADATIDFSIISVDLIAWLQAIAIVLGHIAGVIVAHDLAVANFDRRNAMRSQYLMLLVMVIYSVIGLWLLLNA